LYGKLFHSQCDCRYGLRHTYATELANSEVSVYTLMKMLGHESMATSQRHVAGAARETRTAAVTAASGPARPSRPESTHGRRHVARLAGRARR
jgi:integrase